MSRVTCAHPSSRERSSKKSSRDPNRVPHFSDPYYRCENRQILTSRQLKAVLRYRYRSAEWRHTSQLGPYIGQRVHITNAAEALPDRHTDQPRRRDGNMELSYLGGPVRRSLLLAVVRMDGKEQLLGEHVRGRVVGGSNHFGLSASRYRCLINLAAGHGISANLNHTLKEVPHGRWACFGVVDLRA